LERIAACVEEAVVVYHARRVGYERIGRDEGAKGGVVVSGVVVEEAGGVALLPGEGAVGLEIARRGALRTVGIVCAAGLCG
ncbi:MAG: hypothetical protein OXG26_10205, partial [Caldilineaceae bacterium]|nr:hypothetical protein [Caldilineaceae bacterium]